jgi:HEAT repeat protein
MASLALTVGVTAVPAAFGQEASPVAFDQMVSNLRNEDTDTRLRAVQALKAAAFPEAAIPLTRALADPNDRVQLQAIGAELNIFLADKVAGRRHVALVVEVRDDISAAGVFNAGGNLLEPRSVNLEVLAALRTAARDDSSRVATEALYAFGALAENSAGHERRELLAQSGADLAALLGVAQGNVREAAIRVVARLYAWRVGDLAVNQTIGDAVVTAMNDRVYSVRTTAIEALGALRYDRGVQALTDLYRHYERGTGAAAALAALARIAHPTSRPLFAEALASRDVLVRIAAIEGLARSGATDQLPDIARTLESEKNQDAQLAGQFASVLLSDGPVDDLVGGLARSRSHDRAFRYLVEVAPGRVETMQPHVDDPQPAIRVDLLTALGLSGDIDAVSIAERLRQDTDPAVARAASTALMRLNATAALP